MLIVRLKQCEHALRDGRLDTAFELARAADFRADRRGQDLIGHLARAFADRGQEHATGGRLAEASGDCEKAAALAGNTPEVAQLRATIAQETATRHEAERVRGQAIAAARRHLDAGQLTVGAGLLAAVSDEDARAEALKQDLAARRVSLQSALAKASAAVGNGDWETAVDHLGGLRSQFPSDAELRNLSARITQQVSTQIQQALETGRLDRAASVLARLDRLSHATVELDQIRRTLQQCGLAFELIQAAEGQRAMEILRRISPLWPRAKWIDSTIDQLQQLSEALEQIRSGPLGLCGIAPAVSDPNETLPAPQTSPTTPADAPRPQFAKRNGTPAGSRFLLHVDGVGSFQVVTGSAITIGPISSSAAPDVPLLAGAGVPTVTITRSDGDYFLQSRQPVLINDKPTTGKLLSSGDKITMGPRCRLTFRRPSAASGTAVLDISGVRLPTGDVRQVILLDREILIGPGSTTHVRSDELSAPAVLLGGNGKLLLRAAEAVQIDGRPAHKPAEIPTGAHVRVGPVSFVVAKE